MRGAARSRACARLLQDFVRPGPRNRDTTQRACVFIAMMMPRREVASMKGPYCLWFPRHTMWWSGRGLFESSAGALRPDKRIGPP